MEIMVVNVLKILTGMVNTVLLMDVLEVNNGMELHVIAKLVITLMELFVFFV